MAAGTIFTVLANIPWKTVIENAPKVAEGTVKLWNTVSGWRKSDPVQNTPMDAPIEPATSTDDALLKRLHTLENSVRHLNEQMQMSSELLKALGEQNIKLVQRGELNRQRVARLTRMVWGISAVLVAVVFYLLMSR